MTIGEMDPNFKEKWNAHAASPIRLIIAGGRDFSDYPSVKHAMQTFCDDHYVMPSELTIISGMCRGADLLGVHWAEDNKAVLIKMPAWWRGKDGHEQYNNAAGYQRNERMAKVATHLLAFWDGKSNGTNHMIELGRHYKLITEVIPYV